MRYQSESGDDSNSFCNILPSWCSSGSTVHGSEVQETLLNPRRVQASALNRRAATAYMGAHFSLSE